MMPNNPDRFAANPRNNSIMLKVPLPLPIPPELVDEDGIVLLIPLEFLMASVMKQRSPGQNLFRGLREELPDCWSN